ncbi:glycosyltransferase family 4 protein [Sphingobacterium sp. SYP-B4668]|uniref:glycosyltransferase family 4 protein n=1 Tax=Sphingobacterium sp. SYP-B4668 TaxID=2996035 RepID=UPI0022DD6678|nr:glycosyltransferase family 4 protein [Sphingobacterium sp. SYP-B4668]
MKTAIIGTYPPRQCGIATFTKDLYKSLTQSSDEDHGIFSISDGTEHFFPEEVVFVIDKNHLHSYLLAAQLINQNYDACIIQHEYGIFGGETGKYIIDLLQHLKVPVVTNLHTVLQEPHANEHRVLRQLSQYSSKLTVMTQRAITMLEQVYQIPSAGVALIPHGVPDFAYNQETAKKKLGLQDKKIMLSFGFLGRSKGIETALDAVAQVKEKDFQYIILGTTHPNILREEGEAYRISLMEKVKALGIEDKVQFVNLFASERLLVQYLSACDIYVTPYPNENQISSGTLSFAIGAGAAVISTPYWYAKDLLAEDRGILFPFRDALALSHTINTLLDQPSELMRYRNNAARYGRQMSWINVGKRHLALLDSLQLDKTMSTIRPDQPGVSKNITPIFPSSNNRLSS